VLWIILWFVIGLLLLGAERGTWHRAPEMVQKEQLRQAAGQQADEEAHAIEVNGKHELNVPPKTGNGSWLEH